jgi:hypothetical protein
LLESIRWEAAIPPKTFAGEKCVKAASNCLLLMLTAATPAYGGSIAIGDSLAVGFGEASHVTTVARVGASSCAILGMVPSVHYDTVLISAGTNDPPGSCVEKVRERVAQRVRPSKVVWIVPVNGARDRVLQVAARYGDELLRYMPGRGRAWPHPNRYWKVF